MYMIYQKKMTDIYMSALGRVRDRENPGAHWLGNQWDSSSVKGCIKKIRWGQLKKSPALDLWSIFTWTHRYFRYRYIPDFKTQFGMLPGTGDLHIHCRDKEGGLGIWGQINLHVNKPNIQPPKESVTSVICSVKCPHWTHPNIQS